MEAFFYFRCLDMRHTVKFCVRSFTSKKLRLSATNVNRPPKKTGTNKKGFTELA